MLRKPFPTALFLAAFALPIPSLRAQDLSVDLTARVDAAQILRLEGADGKSVGVPPTAITKTKQVTLMTVKRTGYFEVPAPLPKAQPSKIHFGPQNPEKGWGLRLARLSPKEGKAEVTMKMAFSMAPTKEFEPYPDSKLPEAVKAPDGTYVLTLPKPLAPGVYAVVGFNGSAASYGGFSKHDGAAWIFEVEASAQ